MIHFLFPYFFSLLGYQSAKSHVTKGLLPKEPVSLNMAVFAKCETTLFGHFFFIMYNTTVSLKIEGTVSVV